MLVRCQCGHEREVKDDLQGQVATCPKCRERLTLAPAQPISAVAPGFVARTAPDVKPWIVVDLAALQARVHPHFPGVVTESRTLLSVARQLDWMQTVTMCVGVLAGLVFLFLLAIVFINIKTIRIEAIGLVAAALFWSLLFWVVSVILAAIRSVLIILAELSVGHAARLVQQDISLAGQKGR